MPVELQVMRKLKAYDTIQEHNQLTKVTKLPAEPFTLIGNIWKMKYNTRYHAEDLLCLDLYFHYFRHIKTKLPQTL